MPILSKARSLFRRQRRPAPLSLPIRHCSSVSTGENLQSEVDSALRTIVDGVVGFDTEFMPRKPTASEQLLTSAMTRVGGNRKSAILAWQLLTASSRCVSWENIGLCVVQLATESEVWVINMTLVKGKLRRILSSLDIMKVGVGLLTDIPVIWNDLGTDLRNLADAGMMAKLLLVEKNPSAPYANLSLQESVAEILGFHVDKDERKADWKAVLNAAIDAVASLRLYNRLLPALQRKSVEIQKPIPETWYRFNSLYGEPMQIGALTWWGEQAPWSTRDCRWFFGGKFQGYHYI
ncbi:ribonuclease H-like domain-containing protein [Mycena rebaudengoi]|nr:ribonuclease H-like domain-containing protein [Mycena rebaudengoi]